MADLSLTHTHTLSNIKIKSFLERGFCELVFVKCLNQPLKHIASTMEVVLKNTCVQRQARSPRKSASQAHTADPNPSFVALLIKTQ